MTNIETEKIIEQGKARALVINYDEQQLKTNQKLTPGDRLVFILGKFKLRKKLAELAKKL